MNVSSALCLTAVLVSAPLATACKKPLDPPPAPPPTITQSTFEPVYRASKALQGATAAGVTYVQFGELMQDLSTEIGIAKDHQMNDLDRKLVAVYDEAFAVYQLSAELWKAKFDASDDMWKDEIPVSFEGDSSSTEMLTTLAKYKIPVYDRKVPYTGKRYKAIKPDAVARIWSAADEVLQRATEMYYGRSSAKDSSPSSQ